MPDSGNKTEPASASSGQLSAPSLSLPKGGGPIRGIGEKFAANPVTGTGSFSVPLASSPGRAGFGPQLSLSYDSGAGNGPFGFGWSLGLPAITRKTDKGLPRYQDADELDVFVLSGAEDQVPVLDQKGNRVELPRRTVHGVAYDIYPYRPRIEGLFARIERWVAVDTGISHWRSITRDNVTALYGFDEDSRIAAPTGPLNVISYLICRTWDDKGNIALYQHVAEDGKGEDGQGAIRLRPPELIYRTPVEALAASADTMGPPIATVNVAGAEVSFDDTTLAPGWRQVWYRAVAWSARNELLGLVEQRSPPSGAVATLLPPAAAPDVADLRVNETGSTTA